MPVQQRLTVALALINFAVISLAVSGAIPAWSADTGAEVGLMTQSRQQTRAAVLVWFRKYDQIRRDAEETTKDKYQSLFLSEGKPDKKNADLASRMIEKYTVALSAMKRLPVIPETKELHKGYIEYFSSARQLFTEFLKGQKTVPYSVKRFAPAKNRLEALDKVNKRIDAELRKKYGIPKHKHS